MTDKTAECIRKVSNFSKTEPVNLIDKKGFDPTITKLYIDNGASPKLQALFEKIDELDKKDMKETGRMFKHIIFTDIKSSSYGAKIIASAFVTKNMTPAFRAQGRGFLVHDNETLAETQNQNFAILLSKTFYNRPMSAKFRKDILGKFNSRPENIHGEQIRFMILDQGFKEGIDVFDVKYLHLFEPLVFNSDEKQAIGRGTRFCGQKGLEFHPSLGWPLHVFKYDISIVPNKQNKMTGTLSELYIKHLGIDLRKTVFASDLEKVTIGSAVDNELNSTLHNFKIQKGGASSTYVPPNKIMNLKEMMTYIRNFNKFAYPTIQLENKCVSGGATDVVSFTPSQNFVRHYFQQSSAYKGLLLHHSVGTGKTCTAIASATTGFEDYTILWVTRHTLKNDIWKNMFDQVCHVGIQDKIDKGLPLKKVSIKSKSKLISDKWMNPISYKQFSNMLLKKNKIYDEMVKRNGEQDPLRKTLLIIDEAHKLYAPSVAQSEKPNTDILEEMIQKSYNISGDDSVRLLVMTATPYTEDGMEMVKLLNLLRQNDKFPDNFENFSSVYLDDGGKFTKSGITKFQNQLSGYISYLNRSNDARSFAYPVMHDVVVNMSVEKKKIKTEHPNTTIHKTIKGEIKELNQIQKIKANYTKALHKKCLSDAKDDLKSFKKATMVEKNDLLSKCKDMNVKERKECRQKIKEDNLTKKALFESNISRRTNHCENIILSDIDLGEKIKEKREILGKNNQIKIQYKENTQMLKEKIEKTKREITEVQEQANEIKNKIAIKNQEINKLGEKEEKTKARREFRKNPMYSQLKEVSAILEDKKGVLTNLKAKKKVAYVTNNPSRLRNISQEYALTKICKI
jgi:hypothetical protein